MSDVDLSDLKHFDDEDMEVARFKAESIEEELRKFPFTGMCDHVSSMYHLDKDLSKGHESLMFMIRNFAHKQEFQDEYIRRLFYHDLSRSPNKVCPNVVDHEFIITQAREKVFMKACEMEEFQSMKTAVLFMEDPKILNPYGRRNEEKFSWFEPKKDLTADFFYFVDSADLLFNHDRVKKLSFLLDKLKIGYTMSEHEKDSGYLARVVGRYNTAEKLREMNREMILKDKFKQIIVSDPHAYIELKDAFKDSSVSVWYLTDLAANKIFSLNSKQIKKRKMKAAFQSSTIMPLRTDKNAVKIMKNIGFEVVETLFTGEHALSTSEGGAFSLNFKEDSLRIAAMRLQEAKDAGAEAIVTDSPHDHSLLLKARKKFSIKIKIYDLLSEVTQAVKWARS